MIAMNISEIYTHEINTIVDIGFAIDYKNCDKLYWQRIYDVYFANIGLIIIINLFRI